MKKLVFHDGWRCRQLREGAEWKDVAIPHDAMLSEDRDASSVAGINNGWFVSYDYEYEKTFSLPETYKGKDLILEFEGVYRNAEVYVNGEKAAFRPYGYTNFYVDITNLVKIGQENVVKVIARNADQPNSRWYSGTGIYRPVSLWVGEKKRIALNGVKVKTKSIQPAVVEVSLSVTAKGNAKVEILDGETVLSSGTLALDDSCAGKIELTVENAKLWSPETPELYDCRVTFGKDVATEKIGIRIVTVNAKEGLCVNGKRVILRGACIHHDNGILGACCFPEAEERKIRLLKEYGYNAVRSAHNPCSKALLDVCDRLGVLVMDEYVDEWYVHKTMYGYANLVGEWWREDLKDMVDKDYNHPSVVMYSTGNEVGETSEERGIALTKEFTDYLHSLDDTRTVSCGINIWFNAMYSMGFGQYSDEKAKKAAEAKSDKDRKKQAVGSEFFNNLAGMVGADFMKIMATIPLCDKVTRDAYANMDVAGYNYGIKRYRHDMKKYPDRVILGSETFCSDAYIFYEMAKENPALIGDFVWAGIDYLGELGVGSWEYEEYAPDFNHGVGWMTAGSGRLDLIGDPLGEALYTKVAFELEDKPQIAVVPVTHTDDKHSPSAWKFSNAIPSWSWKGCEGKKAKVEVYSRAPVVELYVNGTRVGRKKFGKNCRFDFTTIYRDGEITAVALDKDGKELSRNSLKTAGEETILSVTPEKSKVKKGEICFIPLTLSDRNGERKPAERKIISVKAEGGELIALGSACPYSERSYLASETDTYYGRAMAVVRASGKKVKITATAEDLSGEAEIAVEE